MSKLLIDQHSVQLQELDLNIRDFIDSFPEELNYHQVHKFSLENRGTPGSNKT